MIGVDTLGWVGASDDLTKHPAQVQAIDRALVYGKADDTAAPLIAGQPGKYLSRTVRLGER
ncbi:MAG TPA: hypothetical protein ENI68_03200 [Gammaproteobacteria bacterium]|nr:hypothetical protein [Gammaproteobacteria bacterium]